MLRFSFLQRPLRLAVLALACLWSASALAASPTEAVQQRFESVFQGIKVDGVTLTPYGLYEVQVGGDLIYTDANVSYVLQGVLMDTATRRNVTAARQEQLLAVPFDQLPLELAFVQTYGDGSRKMAVFEDPNCGYCKQMRKSLLQLKDTTVYTFMLPMLSPDSVTKVEAIWCAQDKAATWDAWMLHNRTPPPVQCDAPVKELLALGQRLNVRGTPTTIFADGSRASGALPLPILEDRLLQAEAP